MNGVGDSSKTRSRVLIIDDDPLFRNLMVSLLRRDFVVSVASSGEEGFQKAVEHVPDVAVIDIQMPGWNGLKTLTEFRKNPELSNVKTMVLTGDSSRETVLAAIQAGACDYFIKSGFNKEEFVRKLARLGPQAVTVAPQAATVSPNTARVAKPVSAMANNSLGDDSIPRLQETIDGWE